MRNVYVGVNNKAKKVKNIFIGVNGKARRVKAGFIGVNGKARQFYPSLQFSYTADPDLKVTVTYSPTSGVNIIDGSIYINPGTTIKCTVEVKTGNYSGQRIYSGNPSSPKLNDTSYIPLIYAYLDNRTLNSSSGKKSLSVQYTVPENRQDPVIMQFKLTKSTPEIYVYETTYSPRWSTNQKTLSLAWPNVGKEESRSGNVTFVPDGGRDAVPTSWLTLARNDTTGSYITDYFISWWGSGDDWIASIGLKNTASKKGTCSVHCTVWYKYPDGKIPQTKYFWKRY